MDFMRKAQFVANGSTTDAPVALCYSSVVSRDSVRIAFLVAALNDLDVCLLVISTMSISTHHALRRFGFRLA